jgi:hypothetical protein
VAAVAPSFERVSERTPPAIDWRLPLIRDTANEICCVQLRTCFSRPAGSESLRELVKVARKDGAEFICAPWVHKAKEPPKEQFKREVDWHLTGKETEAWEILYFKVYKSQLGVIEKALETAALMLGSGKSRGYCLEMICADFLAGATLESQPNK